MESTGTTKETDAIVHQREANQATIREWVGAGLKPADIAELLDIPIHEVVSLVKPQKYTRLNQTRFLQSLRETGNITISAYECGVSRQTIYKRMEADDEFEAAVRSMIAENTEIKEYQIDHRAFQGVLEPVFNNGKMVCYPELDFRGKRHPKAGQPVMIRKFSDSLAQMRMKALKPDEYAQRQKSESRTQLTFEDFLSDIEAPSDPDADADAEEAAE